MSALRQTRQHLELTHASAAAVSCATATDDGTHLVADDSCATTVIKWAIIFFVISLVAGLFGF
ncbi:MAG: DUF1328 domain-containing protein [Steroidobacteraceae bacterium]